MRDRRGFILVAVLVVVLGAALVATMLVRYAGAENAVAAASAERAASRALAASGTEIVLAELDRQRADILEGRTPRLDDQYVIHESPTELGVMRLLPPRGGSELLVPVGGLLDLNRATAAQLAATGLLDLDEAERIVGHRSGRDGSRFRSVEDLLEVTDEEGVPLITPERLMGPLDRFEPSVAILGLEQDRGERLLDALGGDGEPVLLDVLTVHSFEPALQRSGVLRINLDVPWSDELGRRMDDRFGEGTGESLERLMRSFAFEDDSAIVRVLRALEPEPGDGWVEALDALTTDERWQFGRVDLNTAPAAVLRSLEGLEPELADRIVRERNSLTAEELATPVWPLLRELLTPEVFQTNAGRLTNRCWIWRVRIAAGTVPVDEPDGAIETPVILDLTVDLAAPRPRLAALRDISGLEVGVRLLEGRGDPGEGSPAMPGSEADGSSEEPFGSGLFDDLEPLFDDAPLFDDESFFTERESVFATDGPDPDEAGTGVERPPSGPGDPDERPGGRWSPG